MKRFWNWKTTVNETGESERILQLYGTIAEESWWDDEVSPQMFRKELNSGKGPVTVYINSPGGDCVAASQIYTMLLEYKDDVTVKIDGMAASAASVIAMAGNKVLMAPTATMMIHNPLTFAMGNEEDMQKAIDMLSEVKESIINAYEIKTGLSRTVLSHMMDAETWMNAGKAKEYGFIDGILESADSGTNDIVFAYERRTTSNLLLNKISQKYGRNSNYKPKHTVDEYLDRLNLLKY